jgi:hypothetical protein
MRQLEAVEERRAVQLRGAVQRAGVARAQAGFGEREEITAVDRDVRVKPDGLAGRDDRVATDRRAQPMHQPAQARPHGCLVGLRPQHPGDASARQRTRGLGEDRQERQHVAPADRDRPVAAAQLRMSEQAKLHLLHHDPGGRRGDAALSRPRQMRSRP